MGALILHLGAHRTASTAVQELVAANTGRLNADGHYLWQPNFIRDLRVDRDPKKTKQNFSRAFEKWRRDTGEYKTLVLSDKNFLGNPPLTQVPYFYPIVESQLDRAARTLFTEVDRITITVRNYLDWCPSAYFEMADYGWDAIDPALAKALIDAERGWKTLVVAVAAQFPKAKISIFPYELLQDQIAQLPRHWFGPVELGENILKRRFRASGSVMEYWDWRASLGATISERIGNTRLRKWARLNPKPSQGNSFREFVWWGGANNRRRIALFRRNRLFCAPRLARRFTVTSHND